MASLSWISSNPDYINQMIRNTQVTLSNNYNDLDNIPIIKITSTTNNPQKVWELKEGLYMINGIVQVDNSTSYEVSNLLISMTARLENGKYILSAFIPYLRGLFEYILKTNSTEYEQHQKIVLMIKNDTLTLDNETIYTPIEDYHPATKKYVDDKANEIVTELDKMGVNKENLESLNKENRIRDIKLQALLNETSDRNITIEEDIRYFDMPLSIDNGIVTINEIIGETLVNVCDQEESVAITKSYTVENENHIPLQGEYDGSCMPVVHGNTLVNHNADWDDSLQTGIETSASGIENVEVEGIKGQEVSVVVEGNTVLNHALGKTSAVVSSIESENEGNYVDLTVANDMSSVVEIEGRTMVNCLKLPKQVSQFNAFKGEIDEEGYLCITANGSYQNFFMNKNNFIVKPSTIYTFVVDIKENTLVFDDNIHFMKFGNTQTEGSLTYWKNTQVIQQKIGRIFFTLTTRDSFENVVLGDRGFVDNDCTEGTIKFKYMIFEGDLTQTPHLIPNGYVEGLKSSYEYEVTEDGKYKVDVKVTGKNLFDKNNVVVGSINNDTGASTDTGNRKRSSFIKVKPNTSYTINQIGQSFGNMGSDTLFIHQYDYSYNHVQPSGNNVFSGMIVTSSNTLTFTTKNNTKFVRFRTQDDRDIASANIQLEEGTEATSYEPYFESTKTFYLNSPLLEGDKIVTKNGKVYHYHKMGKVVFDGSESWSQNNIETPDNFESFYILNSDFNKLANGKIFTDNIKILTVSEWDARNIVGIYSEGINAFGVLLNSTKPSVYFKENPTTVVYELDNPYYELIDEYNNTILNIPNTVAHLTHTSAVPVNNTVFTNYKDELNVLEANTQYRLMFDCDTANVPFTITLGGTSQIVTSKKGTHSLLITTPSELVDKNLVIDGIGRCGINNIRIFKGDVEYNYVKGLWSGYEERKLENLLKGVEGTYLPTWATFWRENGDYIECTNPTGASNFHWNIGDIVKPNTVYTVVFYIEQLYNDNNSFTMDLYPDKYTEFGTMHSVGYKYIKFTSPRVRDENLCFRYYVGKARTGTCRITKPILLEGDWTDNPPTYEEVIANEGKYAVKVKLDTNATIFGKGGRL